MLTPEIKAAIERADLISLATASRDGIPNVVPVHWIEVVADDTIWITDNYFSKTLANLRDNPRAAFYVWSPEPRLCVQAKGSVEISTEGPDYEQMRARVRSVKPDLPAKALVVFRIEEIYECLPGATAGERLWPRV